MRRASILLAAATLAAIPAQATAAPVSAFDRKCSNRGYRAAITIGVQGRTNCSEARFVIRAATRNERARTRKRTWTVRLPHGTWRCRTVRRREAHGVLETRWRTTCTLRGRQKAKVRWFND